MFSAALSAALIGVAVLAALGPYTSRPPARVAPPPTPAPTATPTAESGPPAPGLALGITEYNPNLVASPADRALPEPWGRWRDALGALHPQFFRLVIDWRHIQPAAGAPANLANPETGCERGVAPCLPYGGVLDQLRALASRQRQGGWRTEVVINNAPDWAAAPASGCERPGTDANNRGPSAAALPAYKALIEALQAAARQAGATLDYWSAWNEPNHPAFISPQRADCSPASPSLAPASYAQIARTLQSALQPGQQLVLGETAGLMKDTRYSTSVPSFIAGLPQDLLCAATIWTQHAYIGGVDPVPGTEQALAARGCPRPFTIWITETGVGDTPRDLAAGAAAPDDAAGCRELHQRLVSWYEDPQVTAAFQYEFRNDDVFPTGLVTTDLTAPRASLAEWSAWGARPSPSAPPPPSACGA